MKPEHLPSCLLPCVLSVAGFFCPEQTLAQANIVPAADGTGTIVTSDGDRFDIQGGSPSGDGQNLFHSFEKLGLETNQIANFLANPNLQNILGRIVGGDPSIINGLIQVTGGNPNLYLMNPAGFIFGQNAQLNISGDFFVTTATGIGFEGGWFESHGSSPYQVLVGNPNQFSFATDAGTILNRGNLGVEPGKSLTFAANRVNNQGTLSTPGGTITLTAVEEGHILRISQEGMVLSLEVSIADLESQGGFSVADLPTLLTGSQTISESGTTTVSGSVNVSSPRGEGGTVNVLGTQIEVIDGILDASGLTGGGTVHLGGTYQGGATENPYQESQVSLPNALDSYINNNSQIRSDALQTGDGGQVIVWADRTTSFYGNISARGGSVSGNGGFVEVSGKEHLLFRGFVDTQATQGNFGTLLLDPETINIVAGTGDGDGDTNTDSFTGSSGSVGEVDAGDPNPTIIYESELEGLASDTSIIIVANNGITIEPLEDGELRFASNGGGGNIRLEADGDGDGSGAFFMETGDTITALSRNLSIQGSSLTLGEIDTEVNGGDINLTTTNGDITTGNLTGGNLTLIPSNGNVTTGNITGENLTLSGGDLTIGTTTVESLNLSSGNLLTLNGDLTATNAIDFSFLSNGIVLNPNEVVISSAANLNFSSISITGDALTLVGSNIILDGEITLNSLTITNNGLLQFGGNLGLTGGSFIQNGTGSVELVEDATLNSGGGDIEFTGAISGNQTLSLEAVGGDVTLNNGANLSGLTLEGIEVLTLNGDLTANNDLTLTNINEMVVATDLTVTTNNDLNLGNTSLSGDNNLTVVGDAIDINGSVALADLTLTNTETLTLNSTDVNLSGSLTQNGGGSVELEGTINAEGDINFADDISLTGETTLNTSGGNITTTSVTGNETLNVNADAGNMSLGIVDIETLNPSGDTLFLTDNLATVTPLDFSNLTAVDLGNDIAIASSGTLDLSETNFTGTNQTLAIEAETILLGDLSLNGVNLRAENITLGTTTVENIVLAGNNNNPLETLTLTGNLNVNTALDLTTVGEVNLVNGGDIIANGDLTFGSSTSLVSGGNTLLEGNNIDLGPTDIQGNLDVSADGNIVDSGDVNVAGILTLEGNNITLDNENNLGTEVNISSNDNVILNQAAGSLTLGASTVEGNLDLTAPEEINNNNPVIVAGTTTLRGETVTLTGDNDLATVILTDSQTVTLEDIDEIDLGLGAVAGDLTVEAGTNVTQSDDLTVGGTATINAEENIALNGNNDFNFLSVTGETVTVSDRNEIILQESTITNNFTLTSNGQVENEGTLTVGGVATFETGNNDLILDHEDNDFNSVTVANTENAVLNDGNALDLGNITVNNTLTVTAETEVTGSGAVVVGGTTQIDGGGEITLSNIGNDFNELSLTSAGDEVNILEANEVTLGSSTLSGNLTLVAGGEISSNGAIEVAGTASFDTNDSNITLDDPNNNFTVLTLSGDRAIVNNSSGLTLGEVNLTGTFNLDFEGALDNSGTITVGDQIILDGGNNDITLVTDAAAGTLTILNGGDVTLTHDGDLALGELNLGGDLDVVATGLITSSGNLDVEGNASFTTTLADAGNVQLTNEGDLTLNSSTIGGNLVLETTGNISQQGTVSVAGEVEVNTSETVSLAIVGTVNLSNGDVIITEVGEVDLPAQTVTGNLVVNSLETGEQFDGAFDTADAIILNQAGNSFGGEVTITTASPPSNTITGIPSIVQSGAQVIEGTVIFNATPTGTVVLDNPNNQFNQVQITAAEATLNAAGELTLGTTAVTNNLNLTTTGDIFGSDPITVGDTLTLDTNGNRVTLDGENDFTVVSGFNSEEVSLNDINDLDLGDFELEGNLNLTTEGEVTDSGTVTVGGTTSINSNGITLDNGDNDFNEIALNAGGTVILTDVNDVVLTETNIDGDITVTTQGNITDNASFNVTGTATLNAPNGDIILDNSPDFNTVELNANTVFVEDPNNINLGNSTITETLTLSTQGEITDTGVITVVGLTSLDANSGEITFDNNPDFATVSVLSGNNVTLTDINALDLGAFTLEGDLTVTAAGEITNSGSLVIGGDATFTTTLANAGNVQLTNSGVTVLDTSLIGGNFRLDSEGGISQTPDSAIQVAGNATLNAPTVDLNNPGNVLPVFDPSGETTVITRVGEIILDEELATQTIVGDLVVNALATSIEFTEVLDGTDAITLNNAGNQFGGRVSFNTVTSELTEITGVPSITQNNPLTVTGTATFNATTAGDIILNQGNNDFNILQGRANNLEVTDATGLDLGTTTLEGNLTLTTGGDITNSGAVTVGQTTLLDAQGNEIILDGSGNNFNNLEVSSGSNLTLVEEDNLNLLGLNLSENLTLTVAQNLINSGEVNILGNSDLDIGGNLINENLINVSGDLNAITGESLINNGIVIVTNNAEIITGGDITNSVTGLVDIEGDLAMTTSGEIISDGVIQVAGETTITSLLNISLNNPNNILPNLEVEGIDVVLTTESPLNLGTSNVEGNLTIATEGDITNSGAVTVSGVTSLQGGIESEIALDYPENDFTEVNVESIGDGINNLFIRDRNDLELGTLDIQGNLDVVTQGEIGNSGNWDVGGTIVLNPNLGNITLTDIDNNRLAIANAQDVTLTQIDQGLVTITETENVLIQESNGINLVLSDISGDVEILSEMSIEQFGLDAQRIGNLIIQSEEAVTLESFTVIGDLTVIAGGEITAEGGIQISGNSRFNANGNDIFFDNTYDHNFATVEIINGENVTLYDIDDITLNSADVTGNLTLITEGNIASTQPLTIAGTLSLQTPENINLVGDNDFNVISITNSQNVVLNDINDLNLENSQVRNDLDLTIQGNLEDAGDLTVEGMLTLDSGQNIILDNNNQIDQVTIVRGNDVILNSVDNLSLNPSTITGNLNLTAIGNILDEGEVNVAGESFFTTTEGNIIFDQSNLGGLITLMTLGDNPSAVTLINGSDVYLASANITGNLRVESPGELEVNQGITANEITLTAQENLTAQGSLDTSSNTTDGGKINLTSTTGVVIADNIDSSGVNGGEVVIIAEDAITTGEINSQGTINGGDVFLDPIGDVVVTSINAQGGSSGVGGNVDITAGNHFRATGSFIDLNGTVASISTLGGNESGNVIIRHGGQGDVPFNIGTVGAKTLTNAELLNGTEGAISTSLVTLNNESLPYNTQRENVEIISGVDAPTTLTTIPNSVDLVINNTPDPLTDIVTSSPESQALEDIEEGINESFEQYFGWEPTSGITFQQAQELLRTAEQTTHTRSAVVYALFVPQTLTPVQGLSITPETESRLSSTSKGSEEDTTYRLELLLIPPNDSPRLYSVPVNRREVLQMARKFRQNVNNYQRPRDYQESAQKLHQWLISPLESDLQTLGIENLVYIPDTGLRTIPFAALHDGEQFVIEKYAISLMPSLSLTDTQLSNLHNQQVLAMGAETFTGTPRPEPLPAVAVELEAITNQFWSGQKRLNEEFILPNLLEDSNNDQFGILHLATHADFLPGNPRHSYIRLWDNRLGLDQLDDLGLDRPTLDLLILSACRTAFDDPDGSAELGFAGLAHHIGVKSTVGSLWNVSDEGTLGLMTSFYSQLSQVPTKVEALRQAQLAMLRGEVFLKNGQLSFQRKLEEKNNEFMLMKKGKSIELLMISNPKGEQVFTHPYYWSAFTMIGNPW